MSDRFELEVPGGLEPYLPVEVALILGSGLSGIVSAVTDTTSISYDDIDGLPRPLSSVAGHAGRLVIGTLGGRRVACFSGRLHAYQGLSARDAAYPARLAAALGARTLIVTNAAGGVADEFEPGDLALISDQLNLTGDSPLVGWPGPPGGNPFVPMLDAYDPELRATAQRTADDLSVPVHPQGVYAGVLGPAYETPAEVKMLRALGADTVGMSTVHEVIAARALGMRVLGISLVTNVAAGPGINHDEVLEAGRIAAERMERLIIGILHRLP